MAMTRLAVSNADRVVFPELGRTKGDVVAYYERMAERALLHVIDRPLSIRRYPKGLAGPGFFQKNVPAHYPESIRRFAIPRSKAASKKHQQKSEQPDATVYPLINLPEHLAYLANQGAIELHVPTARAPDLLHPDRLVIDLDPPPDAVAAVRRAALITRDELGQMGLACVPLATGSKGFHLIAPLEPAIDGEVLLGALQRFSELLAVKYPEQLTTAFRIAERGGRVFVDWMRNGAIATVVAPYSLRARPRATVATPLSWDEFEDARPDAFNIDDGERLLERPDFVAELRPNDPLPFVSAVDRAFEQAGLVLKPFDRFRS